MITIENASSELLKFREKYGITQERVAQATHVSKPTIINIEKGRKRPRAATVFKLNQYIGLFPELS